jgi:hypothetical protein
LSQGRCLHAPFSIPNTKGGAGGTGGRKRRRAGAGLLSSDGSEAGPGSAQRGGGDSDWSMGGSESESGSAGGSGSEWGSAGGGAAREPPSYKGELAAGAVLCCAVLWCGAALVRVVAGL